ncbi:hypothetical protein B484DRAFT_47498 [Ochromonadaceae sp. CCMP2298]|nr:hypothetical protein B484DRAFT_47498 [Ochromonadaceae sp. CCMP2298]
MQPAVDESPLRPERPVRPQAGATLSSFQKNEALVMTDNSDAYAEWPIQPDKSTNYAHTPIINKVVIMEKKTTPPLPRRIPFDSGLGSMENSLSNLKTKARVVAKLPAPPRSHNKVPSRFPGGGRGDLKGKRNGDGNGRGLMQDSISEMHDEDSTIASQASLSPSPEPDIPSNLMGCGARELLLKAEQLLMDVTGCIKPDVRKVPVPLELTRRVEGLLQLERDVPTTHYTGGAPDFGVGTPLSREVNGDSDLAQIEWLLRGLPEAYESEHHFDDEAVEAILKEGGPPPKQLALPSVYAANQRVLDKLSAARILRIELKHLLVFSVRYGVRKDGTYILIHPPSGCKRPANQPNSIMLPLEEIQEKIQMLRKDQRDSVRNYFVGTADLAKRTEIDLAITDTVMREWINGAPGGCLRVELYGQLAPRSAKTPGKIAYSEPVRLAYALVPLGGILGTASLDAVLHCDLEVDAASHSSITSRMMNVSFGSGGQKGVQKKALGPKLGTVTARISLLPGRTNEQAKGADAKFPNVQKVSDILAVAVVQSGDIIRASPGYGRVGVGSDETKEGGEDQIGSALSYAPEEAPQGPTTPPQALIQAVEGRSVYGPSPVSGFFGIAVCAVEGLRIPLDKVLHLQQTTSGGVQLSVGFRLSPTERDGMTALLGDRLAPEIKCVGLGGSRVYQTNMAAFTPPVLEVWVQSRDQSSRVLIGLAKFPTHYQMGELVLIPLRDVSQVNLRGAVAVALHLGPRLDGVENSLQCSVNSYLLHNPDAIKAYNEKDTTEANAGASAGAKTLGALGAGAGGEQGAQKERERGEHGKGEQERGRHGEEEQERGEQESKLIAEASESGIVDDSIGDICFMLNEKPADAQAPHGTAPTAPTAPTVPTVPTAPTAPTVPTAPAHFHTVEAALDSRGSDALTTGAPGDFGSAERLIEEEKGGEKGEGEEEGEEREEKVSDGEEAKEGEVKADNLTVQYSTPRVAGKQIHLLDFSVLGAFAVQNLKDLLSQNQIFGCYVCYSMPMGDTPNQRGMEGRGEDREGREEYSFWWDGECPVLNGTNRHKFECDVSSDGSILASLGLDGVDGVEGVQFTLYWCDVDGNLPVEPVKLGEALLPSGELVGLMRGSGGTVTLPVRLYSAGSSVLSASSQCSMQLSVGHRIEPVLLHSNFSSVQGSRVDPLSRLLGFDLSMRDLDAMVYSRSGSKIVWTPFEEVAEGAGAEGAGAVVAVAEEAEEAKGAGAEAVTAAVETRATVSVSVVLNEYAHISQDPLPGPSAVSRIICTAVCKLGQGGDTPHTLSETASDAYLLGPDSRSDVILRWNHEATLSLGAIPGRMGDTGGRDTGDMGTTGDNLGHKWYRGSVLVVEMYLRQRLFASLLGEGGAGDGRGARGTIERPMHEGEGEGEGKSEREGEGETVQLTDQHIGSAVVDLSTLAFGMAIQGWYHVMDELHSPVGQIKLSVRPHQSLAAPQELIEREQGEQEWEQEREQQTERKQEQEQEQEWREGDASTDMRDTARDALQKSLAELSVIDELLGAKQESAPCRTNIGTSDDAVVKAAFAASGAGASGISVPVVGVEVQFAPSSSRDFLRPGEFMGADVSMDEGADVGADAADISFTDADADTDYAMDESMRQQEDDIIRESLSLSIHALNVPPDLLPDSIFRMPAPSSGSYEASTGVSAGAYLAQDPSISPQPPQPPHASQGPQPQEEYGEGSPKELLIPVFDIPDFESVGSSSSAEVDADAEVDMEVEEETDSDGDGGVDAEEGGGLDRSIGDKSNSGEGEEADADSDADTGAHSYETWGTWKPRVRDEREPKRL